MAKIWTTLFISEDLQGVLRLCAPPAANALLVRLVEVLSTSAIIKIAAAGGGAAQGAEFR